MSHISTSDVNEKIEERLRISQMQEELDTGLREESNGGINTVEGQGQRD